jgi:uncharacterized protein YuzE
VSAFVPIAERQNDRLRVTLRPSSGVLSSTSLACVVDLTYLGDVVGVEILDFGRQLSGGVAPISPKGGGVRWSYDPEMDAFYIHVAEGSGQVQRKATAVAFLDSDGQLTAIELQP